jgi:nucleotide-binding universal stress UspA family protein
LPHTTADIAALSPVPVFIVRCGGSGARAADAPRLVAIAVDGHAPATALLARWAIAHALRPSDAVLLCHAKPPPGHMGVDAEAAAADERAATIDAAAKALSDFTAGGGGSATVAELATAFDARDALVDLAETGVAGGAGPPDLLILASRGPAALKRAALGSVCAYVIAHAPASLCVVPPPALAA